MQNTQGQVTLGSGPGEGFCGGVQVEGAPESFGQQNQSGLICPVISCTRSGTPPALITAHTHNKDAGGGLCSERKCACSVWGLTDVIYTLRYERVQPLLSAKVTYRTVR